MSPRTRSPAPHTTGLGLFTRFLLVSSHHEKGGIRCLRGGGEGAHTSAESRLRSPCRTIKPTVTNKTNHTLRHYSNDGVSGSERRKEGQNDVKVMDGTMTVCTVAPGVVKPQTTALCGACCSTTCSGRRGADVVDGMTHRCGDAQWAATLIDSRLRFEGALVVTDRTRKAGRCAGGRVCVGGAGCWGSKMNGGGVPFTLSWWRVEGFVGSNGAVDDGSQGTCAFSLTFTQVLSLSPHSLDPLSLFLAHTLARTRAFFPSFLTVAAERVGKECGIFSPLSGPGSGRDLDESAAPIHDGAGVRCQHQARLRHRRLEETARPPCHMHTASKCHCRAGLEQRATTPARARSPKRARRDTSTSEQ